MPRLVHPASGRCATLGVRTLVGRAPTCTLRLTHRRVSGEHAVIAFTSGRWTLRDLGSRNGTVVDDKAVPVGEPVPLQAGASIDFAGQPWQLLGDGPPIARARAEGQLAEAFDGQLALPDAQAPLAVVFPVRGGRWLAEVDGQPRYVADGDLLDVGGQAWTLELPPHEYADVIDPTAASAVDPGRSMQSLVCLDLAPSLDEESVRTSLTFPDGVLEVPTRAAHLLLLHLARERIADAERGLPAAEQGWVYAEVLADAVDMDPQRINVEVYRARRQLTRLGVAGAGELFERRSQTRQIRLGIDRVRVVAPE